MKPTKNRIFCTHINRVKMLFPTKEKADNFIRFNADDIAGNNRYTPIRSYLCTACGGWHVTHKPESETYTRTEGLQNMAYELDRFIKNIKKNFCDDEWMEWQAGIEEAYRWMAELEDLPEYYQLLHEARRQLLHYSEKVKTCSKRVQKRENKLFQELSAERKQLCKSIQTAMQTIDVEQAMKSATRLYEIMSMPVFDKTESKVKKDCDNMVFCFINPDEYGKLSWMSITLKNFLKAESPIKADKIKETVERANRYLAEMTANKVHRHILNPLYDSVLKMTRQMNKSGAENKESFCRDYMSRVDDTAQSYIDAARKYFVQAVDAVRDKNIATALSFLHTADECMKSIPVSPEKTELMKYFIQIAAYCGI